MRMAARRAGHAKLAALIVEALDRIASPAARFDVIDRALLLAKRDALPSAPQELLEFVDGPLHQAVHAILGIDAADQLHEHLGVLIARAGYDPEPRSSGSNGPRTLPAPRPDGQPLDAGIGLCTGYMIAGNVRGRERVIYTIVGDAVNQAARLQVKTRELGAPILLTESTRVALPDPPPVPLRPCGKVSLRGILEDVDVYAVVDG